MSKALELLRNVAMLSEWFFVFEEVAAWTGDDRLDVAVEGGCLRNSCFKKMERLTKVTVNCSILPEVAICMA